MYKPFETNVPGVESPAIGAFAIVPADGADLISEIRAITIGQAAGTLAFISSRDGQAYATGPLPLGTYAVFASRVLASGTSASGLTGWI